MSIIELAHEAGYGDVEAWLDDESIPFLERFAALVRAETMKEFLPAPDGRIPKTVFTLDDISKAAEMGRESGRIEALEEAAKECDKVDTGLLGNFAQQCAAAIRGLK